MNERQEEYVFREGFRRGYEKGKADRHKMLDDGTLVVSVADATAVTRVLVEDDKKNGDLYYADRPKGEWIEHKERTIVRNGNFIDFFPTEYECSNCGLRRATYFINSPLSNFCPNCGCDMRGDSR